MKNQKLADALFVGQLVGLVVYGISQSNRMLTSVQGVSMSVFLLFWTFVGYLLLLSLRAHRAQPSRITGHILIGHTVGIAMVTGFTALLAWHLMTGVYQWVMNDTLTMAVAIVGSFIVIALGKMRGLGPTDPIVRGWLASCCKALPQAFMAWKIGHVGGAGLAATAIWTVHITNAIRLSQLTLSLR